MSQFGTLKLKIAKRLSVKNAAIGNQKYNK